MLQILIDGKTILFKALQLVTMSLPEMNAFSSKGASINDNDS